jgi:hypothetical protein
VPLTTVRFLSLPPLRKFICELTVSFIQKFRYLDLADMLTMMELEEGLLTLRPREFVGMKWTKADLKPIHPDLGGCSHLNRFIQSTNKRIAWIADEIISRGTLDSSLADCIEYFIRVARRALRFNNFNTLFEVVSALSEYNLLHAH